MVQQEEQSQYETVGNRSHMRSVKIKSDIGIVKCQTYGEVGVRNRAGEINDLSYNFEVKDI